MVPQLGLLELTRDLILTLFMAGSVTRIISAVCGITARAYRVNMRLIININPFYCRVFDIRERQGLQEIYPLRAAKCKPAEAYRLLNFLDYHYLH